MSEVDTWLASIGLTQYAALFAGNDIDLDLVREMSEADFEKIGVVSFGHRRKLVRAAASLADAAIPSHSGAAVVDEAPVAEAPVADAGAHKDRPHGGERRHLTVMFCDLFGSTALAARLDPEDVREVVRAYQAACAHVIGKYEGFVAQYLGDGIMAYFGYPRAHEDDAERAVRAGLDLVVAVAALDQKTKVEIRIGIATGLVVVGDLVGEHAAKERAVTGETPNLAARLQALATPGSIVVSATTRRLLGGQFALLDLGAQSVKGLDAPVAAFAVEGVRSFESRFEARTGGSHRLRRARGGGRNAPRLRLHVPYAKALMAVRGHGPLETTGVFARSAELAAQLGDTAERFTALNGIWVGSFVRGEAFRARDMAEAFRRDAKEHLLERETALSHSLLGCTLWSQGAPAEAVVHFDTALAGYDDARSAAGLALRTGRLCRQRDLLRAGVVALGPCRGGTRARRSADPRLEGRACPDVGLRPLQQRLV